MTDLGLKYKFLRDEDQHTLVVIEADQRDAGKYVCEARNEFGEFRSTATLQVNSKLPCLFPNLFTVVFTVKINLSIDTLL